MFVGVELGDMLFVGFEVALISIVELIEGIDVKDRLFEELILRFIKEFKVYKEVEFDNRLLLGLVVVPVEDVGLNGFVPVPTDCDDELSLSMPKLEGVVFPLPCWDKVENFGDEAELDDTTEDGEVSVLENVGFTETPLDVGLVFKIVWAL